MKFTCDKNSFAREISFAQEIIASRNALSIMSNVHLSVQDSLLSIKATDMKVSFQTSIPVDVRESGGSTVFCDKLSGIPSSVPDGEISIEQDDSKVILKPKARNVRFQLRTLSGEKFPELPAAPGESFFSVPLKDFREMINQTHFAVSSDETRYFMNGVYLETVPEGLVMVATDGRRLGFSRKRLEGPVPGFKGIIIPPKVLILVNRHTNDEGMIDIAVTDKSIFFRFGNYLVASVLIEGQFPNYQKVIPATQRHSLSVSRTELLDALKRVSILVEQKSQRTFFNLSTNTIVLSTEEGEIGTAREEIPCSYDGEDTMMALNCKYVEEPLKAMKTERVSLRFTEPNRAITLSPDPEDDYFHIVMPMQMN